MMRYSLWVDCDFASYKPSVSVDIDTHNDATTFDVWLFPVAGGDPVLHRLSLQDVVRLAVDQKRAEHLKEVA